MPDQGLGLQPGDIHRLPGDTPAPNPGQPSPAETLTFDAMDDPARAGETIGPYKILEKLGQGGMGAVYKALDTTLNRVVALKFLRRDVQMDEAGRATLLSEARASSALDHPNIGTIHGIGYTETGRPFIVMACYTGRTLAERLEEGPVPPAEAANIALQVAAGLAEAHAHNIVHRDIKPSNIFLTQPGLVKVLDFGIARAVRSATSTVTLNSPGTPAYMSPEQAQGGFVDSRTDLFSLGTVMYEMLTGRHPFAAGSVAAILYGIVHKTPGPLPEIAPLPLQKVVYRALAKRPEDRYQGAVEMIRDLKSESESSGQASARDISVEEIAAFRKLASAPAAPHPRPWYRTWMLAPVLMAFAAALLFIWLRQGTDTPAAYEAYLKAVPYMERHEQQKNLDEAISMLSHAVKADPKFALGFASLGEAYWLKSRLAQDRRLLVQAESNARRALELNGSLPRVHIVMGEVQSAQGHPELAEEEYLRALQLDPSSADALTGLAREYARRQRTKEAEDLFRRAAALEPDSWEGHNNLGLFLRDQRRLPEAAQEFREVVKLSPNNVAGYVNLSAALMDDNHVEAAEEPLRKAAAIAPTSYTVHLNLGWLYYMRRLFPQAESEFRRAVELEDTHWLGWVDLAVAHRWLGQDDKAVEAYRRALPLLEDAVRILPRDGVLRATLAEVYAYTGDADKSRAAADAALLLEPNNPKVLLSCANSYAALGDRVAAVRLANDAVTKGLSRADIDADPEARRFRADPDFKAPGSQERRLVDVGVQH